MSYFTISDFKFGIDRRRPRRNGLPGTLWTLKNCHITRGGDIEAAKKFVPTYSLPAGQTFGLQQLRGQLYVFGSVANPSLPIGIQYQRLVNPNGAPMTALLDSTEFNDKIYAVAQFQDGTILHFYDGSQVTDWNSVSQTDFDFTSRAILLASILSDDPNISAVASGQSVLITADTPGTPFTISATATNGGSINDQGVTLTQITPNVVGVAETRATGTVTVNPDPLDTGNGVAIKTDKITGLVVNGVSLISDSIIWQASATSTAVYLANAINAKTSTHGYTAAANNGVVTITAAAGTGSTPNGYPITVTTTGFMSCSTSGTMSGGVDGIAAQAEVYRLDFTGTYEPGDQLTVAINGANIYTLTHSAAGTGRGLYVNHRRIFTFSSSLLRYSKYNSATDWTAADAATGAGYINMSGENGSSEAILAAADYNGYAAIFSPRIVRIYSLSADMTQTTIFQTIPNIGTSSPKSVVSYGNNDVYFLHFSGVRSLRVRDASRAAYSFDAGTAVDSLVIADMQSLTANEVAAAVGTIEPVDGRYLLALGPRIYAYSNFPTAQIAAWSYYEPGFTVQQWSTVDNRLYARAGDTIYLYGGADGTVYPSASDGIEYLAETPFMSLGAPGDMKHMNGFDLAASGEWAVTMLMDANDESKTINVGRFSGTTYSTAAQTMPGYAPRIAFKFSSTKGGYASLSDVSVYFTKGEAT